MAKKSKAPQKPKIPLLLPREHVFYLCRLPAYRKDFEAFRSGKIEKRLFAEKWGLKEPVDPKTEKVDVVYLQLPCTDSRVGNAVEVIHWGNWSPGTPTEAVRSMIHGLHIPVHETSLIGERRLRIEVDLSFPWEGALEEEIKAVVLAARKLAGAPRKTDPKMFAVRVRAASRALRSTSPSRIGMAIDHWKYAAVDRKYKNTTQGKAMREKAVKEWNALQERIRRVLST